MLVGATAALVSACYRDSGGPRPQVAGALPVDYRDVSLEGPHAILDASRFPARYREAPMLAREVAAGRLPPVRERIGRDPLVIEQLHEIGRYGGTLRRAINGPNDIAGVVRFASGPDGFLYWDPLWTTPRPNMARDFELSQDGRMVTLFLRRGMRWSDGAPFTADDVLFWYEDLYLDRRVVPAPSESLRVDGEDVAIRKVDAETVQFVSPRPFPLLVELLASFTDIGGPSFYGRSAMGGFAPRHYLSRFLPKYRSEDAINREAQEAGLLNWAIYLKKRFDCVVHLNPSRDTDLGIRINLSYRRHPEIGDLLGDARFRRGLSLGIDLETDIVDPTLAIQQSMAGELQLSLQLSGAADPFMNPEYLFPYTAPGVGGASGVEYARWFQSDGSAGERPPDEIVEVMELWRTARLQGLEQRTEMACELIRRHVDRVFSIGLVSGGFTYRGVHIRKKNLRNVPRRIVNSQVVKSPANGLPMTFYFA